MGNAGVAGGCIAGNDTWGACMDGERVMFLFAQNSFHQFAGQEQNNHINPKERIVPTTTLTSFVRRIKPLECEPEEEVLEGLRLSILLEECKYPAVF